MAYKMKPRAILIDAMHLCYRHFHVMKERKDSFKDDLFIGFYQGIFTSIRFMRTRYPNHDLYFLWDSDVRVRDTLFADYKKKPRKEKDELESKKNRAKLYQQLPELKKMLKVDGVHQISAHGFEADDVAKYMVERLYKSNKDIILWTGDLDWAQLIDSKVSWVKAGTRNATYNEWSFKDKYGFPPEGIRVFKCLTGDKSDNIKGIYKFPKLIAKSLASRTTSVEGFFYDRAILNDIPEKWRDVIRENTAMLRLNYQLVSLMAIDEPTIDVGIKDKDKLDFYLNKYMIGQERISKADDFYIRKMKERNEKDKEKKVAKPKLQW